MLQNFAKGLLDVVDDLRRISFLGNDKFSSIDTSKGLDGAVQLLKKLHGCLEGAEKQIDEVAYFEFVLFKCVLHLHIALAILCITCCSILDFGSPCCECPTCY